MHIASVLLIRMRIYNAVGFSSARLHKRIRLIYIHLWTVMKPFLPMNGYLLVQTEMPFFVQTTLITVLCVAIIQMHFAMIDICCAKT